MSEGVRVATPREASIAGDPVARGLLRHVNAPVERFGGAGSNVAVALSRLGHRAGALGGESGL